MLGEMSEAVFGRRRVRIIALVALIVAGCATSPPPAPVPAGTGVPAQDPSGMWTGMWSGTPLSLSLTPDLDPSSPSGVYVGSWLVLGQGRPSFSGIITFSRRGEPVSTRAKAWAAYTSGGVALLVQAAPTDGTQELRLQTVDGGQRLVGTGSSSFPWGPQGTVDLHR
jgi:hypothetical protein